VLNTVQEIHEKPKKNPPVKKNRKKVPVVTITSKLGWGWQVKKFLILLFKDIFWG